MLLPVRSESGLPAWLRWLGRISYPLYGTHFVLVYAADRYLHWHPTMVSMIAVPIVSLVLADAVARWYEPAAMRALSTPAPALETSRAAQEQMNSGFFGRGRRVSFVVRPSLSGPWLSS